MTDKRKKFNKKITSSLLIAFGVVMIAIGVGILLSRYDLAPKQSASDVVTSIERLLPERKRSLPEPHYGHHMPSAEIGGEDFVGLIEVEVFDCKLPVGSQWLVEELGRFPMAYSGSVYDRDLIIGGSSAKGQFDFADRIEIGAPVRFTDLYGRQFFYEVSMVNHSDSIETIDSGEDDLTLFARSKDTSKYVIIRCRLSSM